MTTTIFTESNEELPVSYFLDYEFARIGKYVFPSRNLCNLIKEIAENPCAKEARLIGDVPSGIEILDELFLFDDSGRVKEMVSRKNRVIGSEPLDSRDMLFPLKFDRIIPVQISDDYSSMTIGDYKIRAPLGWFANYLTFGSSTNWGVPRRRERVPDFAEQASEALMKSENPIFGRTEHSEN